MIAACAGLWFESYTAEPFYAWQDQMAIRSQVISRYGLKISLNGLKVLQHRDNAGNTSDFLEPTANYKIEGTGSDKVLPANELQTFNNNCVAGNISQPYWLESPHPIGFYQIDNEGSVGNPENPNLASVEYEFIIEGKPIRFERRLYYKYVDPVRGEVYQPLAVTPPVTANILNQVYVYNAQVPQSVQLKLKSFTNSAGSISLKPINGWKITPEKIDFTNKHKGEEWTVAFAVIPTDNNAKNSVLEAVTTVNGRSFDMGLQQISYDHIPSITLFPPSQTKLIDLNLKIAGKKIGYINGAGDLVPDALRQVGYEVHELSENEVMNGDLSGYDAIITGIRAYNVNPRLAIEQPKLLEYVKNGGNLMMQYNNSNGLVTKQLGPYPFKVVNQRVTDENAKITILDKQNPIFNYPNTITQDDFNGWVQERGLYFVGDIDPNYKPVMQMNDPGEAPNNGAVIVGNYGEGRFVYTSLAFFRQLPAGVPGAYRLFINLLSKPKNQPLN